MKRRWIRGTVIALGCVAAVSLLATLGINAHVKTVGGRHILTQQEATTLTDVDCVVVLGCLVREDGTPSDMLRDRLKRGVALYKEGAAPKLLMSGDHGRQEYNEVETMKAYAVGEGVPSEDVFMDHAGFSTYETMYRAREIFGAKKVLVVTQEYHLYRALYIAERLGLEAWGVASDYETYYGQTKRDVREVLARVKDCFLSHFQPQPTFLGEAIPVSGNGDVTND
ncbi:MAG: SanA protein [Ruminococcaceae bacterium]|nr:SanA protein [Oscillospiraceae bacterium]